MPLHQELTSFDIKCCISRKKVGRSIKIFDDNYYAWSFQMTMKKILKYSLRSSLQHGKLKRIFSYTNPNFTDLKLVKPLSFSPSTCTIHCMFCMVWPAVKRGPFQICSRHNPLWNVFLNVLQHFLTCKTFELPLKEF